MKGTHRDFNIVKDLHKQLSKADKKDKKYKRKYVYTMTCKWTGPTSSSSPPSAAAATAAYSSSTLTPLSYHSSGSSSQGDCNSNSECAGTLLCLQRHADDDPIPPGCEGTPNSSWDYCIEPFTA